MLLEKIVPKEEIEKQIKMFKSAKSQYNRIYSSNQSASLEENDIAKMMRLYTLLRDVVVEKLYKETKKVTNKKIKRRDLRQIFDYVMATSQNPSEINKILSKNYCGRCGLCCIEPSPISITSKDYERMIKEKPELIDDIELDLEKGEYKFIEDKPCKFFDENLKKCKIYDIRPSYCQKYPCNSGKVVFAGDCEYIVRYMSEKCAKLLKKCF